MNPLRKFLSALFSTTNITNHYPPEMPQEEPQVIEAAPEDEKPPKDEDPRDTEIKRLKKANERLLATMNAHKERADKAWAATMDHWKHCEVIWCENEDRRARIRKALGEFINYIDPTLNA